MGIGDWFGLGRTAALALNVPSAQMASPWQPASHLQEVWPFEHQLWADVFGQDVPLPLTRAEALQIPAVARSRHLITATVARLPLEAFRGEEKVEPQPYWLAGSDGQLGDLDDEQKMRLGVLTGQSTWQRTLWTADDLLFYGWSLWLVTRFSARDLSGRRFPIRMIRLPYGAWDVDGDGRLIDPDGHPLPEDGAILIQSFSEGILTLAGRTIRAAGQLEQTAADVARRPFRLELHQTTDLNLTKEERLEIVTETRRAMADNEGILFTNSALETKTHSMDSNEQLLLGGRNAAALDIARHMNIPGAMIDATTEGASLEYQTTETRNQQWLDYGLSAYMDAITAALSMDNVVPAGQRIAFDTSSLTTSLAPTTGPATED